MCCILVQHSCFLFLYLVECVGSSSLQHEQKKLQKAISWMTQISIMALPINIVSGFLGMNVYIPGIDRFSSDSDIFWWIVGACFFASIIILLLFATEKKHRWKFGILPSKHEEQLEREPLKYLLKENTVPWFYHHHHLHLNLHQIQVVFRRNCAVYF